MPTVGEIFDFLNQKAPVETKLDFDNVGLLVGSRDWPVTSVLLALEITGGVIAEAKECKAGLVLSHHPLFFDLKAVSSEVPQGKKAMDLLTAGIAAICMHTNLDIADGGVNDVLIRLLGAACEGPLDQDGCGRLGALDVPMPLDSFLSLCKARLQVNGLRYYDAGKDVSRIAVMGGAGGDGLYDAAEKGCDTYVTADIKYHHFLDAARLGINLIDADHFCTENPVVPVLAEKMSSAFPDVVFQVSSRHRALISFF